MKQRAIAFDMSGSFGPQHRAASLPALSRLAGSKRFKGNAPPIVFFSNQPFYKTFLWKGREDSIIDKALRLPGSHGGAEVAPLYALLDKVRTQIEHLYVFTDLCFVVPPPPPYPVTWVLYDDSEEAKVPYGQVVAARDLL